jgi:hypothetical protein
MPRSHALPPGYVQLPLCPDPSPPVSTVPFVNQHMWCYEHQHTIDLTQSGTWTHGEYPAVTLSRRLDQSVSAPFCVSAGRAA